MFPYREVQLQGDPETKLYPRGTSRYNQHVLSFYSGRISVSLGGLKYAKEELLVFPHIHKKGWAKNRQATGIANKQTTKSDNVYQITSLLTFFAVAMHLLRSVFVSAK